MEKSPLTILIIDDSPAEHELYREYLRDDPSAEYRFLDAYTGAEGERLYMEHPVDCVIVDYRLPDIDGIEVLKRLTRKQEVVPAVMLTGEGNETIAVVAMKTGLQDYIPKRVVTPPALKRTIERAVERTRLMQRMEAYRLELERSNEDLERFVSVVAHDLKSPLRAIAQHLQIIDKHNHDILDDRSHKSIGFAVDGAERMRKLIDGLFELARIGFEKHPVSRVDCNQVMAAVKANLAASIEEKNAAVTADPLPVLMGDGIQIMQLLQNLVANAIKFCKEKPEIHVSCAHRSDMWEFSVRDNGIGIPKASQDKIFTIFKRLHSQEEYEGSGVGLAICERVVKNFGGHIGVSSEPGCGSTFTFTLPAGDAAPKEAAA